MRAPSGSRVALACALLIASGGAAKAADAFAAAFPTGGGPPAFHARVLYRGQDGIHRLQLWREGERRLRRDTDSRLTSIATHHVGELGYRLDVYDHARLIHTVVHRTNLYRMGRFTDWDDLAHGLRRPAGAYRLRPVESVRSAVHPVAGCRWYALEQGPRRTSVCWSVTEAFPLLILNAADQPVWRVVAFDHHAAPPAAFRPRHRGYVLNQADADVSND